MREIQQRVAYADADADALFASTLQYTTGFDTSSLEEEVFDGDFHDWGRADVMI
jgi:hypothetical protein